MLSEKRFWKKVQKTDMCWIWTASLSATGYGLVRVDGKLRPAHRVAWELVNGRAVPADKDLCHHCDNRPCVRPDHLFVGSRSDNMQDAKRKGRLSAGERHGRILSVVSARGERQGHAKLTEESVGDIRRMISEGWSQNSLAMLFRVSRGAIEKIAHGETWRHVA